MLDQNNPIEKAGTAKSDKLSGIQQGLVDFFDYWNKISITVSKQQIRIRVERPNGLKTYMREKERLETKNKNAGRSRNTAHMIIIDLGLEAEFPRMLRVHGSPKTSKLDNWSELLTAVMTPLQPNVGYEFKDRSTRHHDPIVASSRRGQPSHDQIMKFI